LTKPSDRHMALAHLWLFSAGIEHKEYDAAGDLLALSLAKLLVSCENEGRREAAAHYVAISRDFADDEITPVYTPAESRRMVAASINKGQKKK
jgi:hypothetical protein